MPPGTPNSHSNKFLWTKGTVLVQYPRHRIYHNLTRKAGMRATRKIDIPLNHEWFSTMGPQRVTLAGK